MSRTYKVHGHKSPGCQWSEAKLKVKRSSLRSKTKVKIKKAPDADDIVLDNREKMVGGPGGGLYLDPLTSEEAFLQNILSMRQAVMNGDLSGGTLSLNYRNLIRYACVTQNLTELSVEKIKECVHRYYACKGGKKNVSAADMSAKTEKKGEKKVRKILYIHGFNGAPVGTTYSRVKKFFADDVIAAKKFDLLKYDESISELREMFQENEINLIVSQSLGAFYALELTDEFRSNHPELFTIIINPCMLPSVEIPKIAKDEIDRQWIEEFQAREAKLYQSVAAASVQSVFGIFGQNDELLSYIDMFNNVYGTKCNGRENSLIVPGGHLLPADSLKEGLTHAMEYLEPLMSNSFQKFKRAVSLYSQDRIDEFADFVIENFEHEEYEKLLEILEIIDRDELETSDMSSYSKKKRNANNVLNEFALERKVYRNQVENHIPQLVENYFLVLYTKDKNLQTYNHWKSELRSYINTICKYSTKSGNKKKIIRYLLIEGFELNNPERVKSMVESKVLSDDISPYCSRISQSIDSLISCLAGEISTESFMLANNL